MISSKSRGQDGLHEIFEAITTLASSLIQSYTIYDFFYRDIFNAKLFGWQTIESQTLFLCKTPLSKVKGNGCNMV
jgi:hypothetical protein